MSKTQKEQLKKLTTQALKLIKDYLKNFFQPLKQISQLEETVLALDYNESSLPKSLIEYQINTSRIQLEFDSLSANIQSLLKTTKDMHGKLNSSDYFPQSLQQNTLALEYLLSIPNRITIIQSYMNLIGNILSKKQYKSNISSLIEMINAMLTTTQYEFND